MKELAIILLNWNGTDDTIECLKSIAGTEADIYILDNNSAADQVQALKQYLESIGNDAITLIESQENLGFARGNNYVANLIKDKYDKLLLLNNDTIVPGNAIENMCRSMDDNGCVAVTCDIRYYSNPSEIWSAGGSFTWYKDRKDYSKEFIEKQKSKGITFISADFITGCALMVKSAYIEKYGLFTERFFHGEEDFNFCLMAKERGARLGVDLRGQILHKVGTSMKPNENINRYINSSIIHYANRVIDYKLILKRKEWLAWRAMYLNMVTVKRIMGGLSYKDARYLKNQVIEISNKYDGIDRELFMSILNR